MGGVEFGGELFEGENWVQQCAEGHIAADAAKAVKIGVFHGPKPDSILSARRISVKPARGNEVSLTVFECAILVGELGTCHELHWNSLDILYGQALERRMERLPLRDSSCVLPGSCAARAITRRRNAAVV